MEGLEISEIDYLSIQLENRYDSEYFKKEYIAVEELLRSKPAYYQIQDYFKVTDGEHGSVNFIESGIKYLTAENIKKGYVDISNIRYVDQAVDNRNARARVDVGDVLVSIKGTLGQIGVADSWLLPANMNRDVAIIKKIGNEKSSKFLAIYLMSKPGVIQSLRGGSGGVQQMITLERLRKFIVPEFSTIFESAISDLYDEGLRGIDKSKTAYLQAEILLLKALGLTNFEPSVEAINIKSFKDSFGESGRLDAEYYQPRYEDWAQAINSYKYGGSTVANICEVKDKNFTPEDDKIYSYIELSDIDKAGGITGATIAMGSDLPTRARRMVKEGDVLVSSIEGSLSSCALVSEKYNNALCSTGFYVLRSSKLNSETLLVLMKSMPIQALLKQGCSGTILTAINNDAFLNVPIPLIDSQTQQKIAIHIQEGFRLKVESECLLEVAKRAVEIAIEQNEGAGLNHIEKSL